MTKLWALEGADRAGFLHHCPGCGQAHAIYTKGGVAWSFDGNMESPTFNPSVRIRWGDKVCHYFLHAGQLEFCSDSTHALAGQTVPLPDYPERSEPFPAV